MSIHYFNSKCYFNSTTINPRIRPYFQFLQLDFIFLQSGSLSLKSFQIIKYFPHGLRYFLSLVHFSKMISVLETKQNLCRSQWWHGTSFVACVKSAHHCKHSSATWHFVLMSISYGVQCAVNAEKNHAFLGTI